MFINLHSKCFELLIDKKETASFGKPLQQVGAKGVLFFFVKVILHTCIVSPFFSITFYNKMV